jgi:hypothetical protein
VSEAEVVGALALSLGDRILTDDATHRARIDGVAGGTRRQFDVIKRDDCRPIVPISKGRLKLESVCCSRRG